MRSCVVVLLCSAVSAAADDDAPSITVVSDRLGRSDEPLLHLDYEPLVASRAPGATVDGKTSTIDVAHALQLVTETEWWQSSPPVGLFGPAIDDVARGWRAGAHLSYDLGLFRVGASAAYGHVDGRYQRDTYRVVGVSVYRTFRLSKSMLAWVALGRGRQTWLGREPPPGEANGTTTMLTIGTTFR